MTFVVVGTAKYIRDCGSFKIASGNRHLLVGHSHAETGVNPRHTPGLENFAEAGESYFYTYTKLRQLIEANPFIENVYLELSNNQITTRMETKIWGDQYLSNFLPRYFPFLTLEQHWLLLRENATAYFGTIPFFARASFQRMVRGNMDFSSEIGGYRPFKESHADSLLAVWEEWRAAIDPSHFSAENVQESFTLHYMQQIVNFCREERINLFFVRLPVHAKHVDLENDQIFQRIRKLIAPEIPFLDFQHIPVATHQWRDLGHLNAEGATYFSKILNDTLHRHDRFRQDTSAD